MSASIAYLVSRYPAISHTFILREVLELRRLGFRIDVASVNDADRPPHALTRDEQLEAQGTYYIKSAGVFGAARAHASTLGQSPAAYFRGLWYALRLPGAGLFYFVEAVMVGQWMRAREYRHLHCHFATPAATVALLVSRVFPVTYSLTVHGPDEFYDVTAHLITRKIENARFICAIGWFARSQLMKLSDPSLWPKLHVAPLGVDPALFAPRPFRSDFDVFEVLCVGRLTPAKGQHVLITAIHRLRSEGRRVRLRLVGDGPDRRSLESAVRHSGLGDNVVLEGAVNQDRIKDLYSRADAFALASFAEGIPVVLMEAMAMEIPCISTWITGIPELIRDGIDGLLTAPSDEVALAEAIARLMDDAGLRQRLGKAGRKRVIERYNLRPNVARLAEVFETQLDEGWQQMKAAS